MVQTIQREFRSRGAKIDRGIAKSLGHVAALVMFDKICDLTAPHLFQRIALILGLFAVCGCGGKAEHKNVCPIDGQLPEWSKPIDAKNCEYSHFSSIERQTHSWKAPCEQNTLH